MHAHHRAASGAPRTPMIQQDADADAPTSTAPSFWRPRSPSIGVKPMALRHVANGPGPTDPLAYLCSVEIQASRARKRGGADHGLEQPKVRNQSQQSVRRHPVVPARAHRDRPRHPRRRHRGLRGSLRRRLALPRGLARGAALDSGAFAPLCGDRPWVLRPGDPAHLPRLRDGQRSHRRRRRRRRLAHRREEHVRQRDRPHQRGSRQGSLAGGARRRPLHHLPDCEGVRGRGTAARHPLRRSHRLCAIHPRFAFHQRPGVPSHLPDGARAEPDPGRYPRPQELRGAAPRLDRRRQSGDDDARVPRGGDRRGSPRWFRAASERT